MSGEATMAADDPTGAGRAAINPLFILITGLFFLSGSAGLVYQVLWMRALGLFFGSDMYGVTIILSTFMGGLALGSLLGGRLAEGTRRPLFWYGVCEVGIGVFALLFTQILDLFDPILRTVYPLSVSGQGWVYQLVRILLASGTLLVPTTLMGATLPLIIRHFVRASRIVGGRAAFFYAVNTLGAVAGTLVAGFVLLPYLGMAGATLTAAAVNLSIGLCCVAVGWRTPLPEMLFQRSEVRDAGSDTLPELDSETRRRVARAAVLALGLSGFCSFALEVVWTRILVVSFSATVYSFASMLVCFLLGIFLGSVLVARRVDRHPDPVRLFAQLELGAGASVAVLCLLINAVPGVFGRILGASFAVFGGGALVFSTLLVSLLFLLVPTTLLGATFAVALRVYTVDVARVGSRTGNLYFSNTVGAILGSLCAGLILIPTMGTKASLALIAVLFAAIGVYLASTRAESLREVVSRPFVAVSLAVAALAAGVSLFIPYRTTLNFNQRAGAATELIYHEEGIQNSIDIVRSKSGTTSLIIGGNVEADDGYTQLRHFILKGHLPLMMLEEPRSVLVVGLGMGITLSSTARHEGVERIDVIELSPEIVEAQQHLREVNDDVLNEPNVHVTIDDGRNYVKMADAKYDMVTADPIHPKISRVGYLYTKQYYEALRSLLEEGGIVCQWMPIYQMSPTRLRSAMGTFAEVFPNATFWYVKNHGLFIATEDPELIDYRRLAQAFGQPVLREQMASIDIHSPEDLLALLLLGPEEIRAYLDAEPDVPINTDDHPYLEYFVPGDLLYMPLDNVRELVKYLVDPTTLVRNQPPESVAEVRAKTADRATRLIEELETR